MITHLFYLHQIVSGLQEQWVLKKDDVHCMLFLHVHHLVHITNVCEAASSVKWLKPSVWQMTRN